MFDLNSAINTLAAGITIFQGVWLGYEKLESDKRLKEREKTRLRQIFEDYEKAYDKFIERHGEESIDDSPDRGSYIYKEFLIVLEEFLKALRQFIKDVENQVIEKSVDGFFQLKLSELREAEKKISEALNDIIREQQLD